MIIPHLKWFPGDCDNLPLRIVVKNWVYIFQCTYTKLTRTCSTFMSLDSNVWREYVNVECIDIIKRNVADVFHATLILQGYCILCYRHRPWRLMRQLTLGMHHERLRELQNNLTEQDTGVRHLQRLHYQLPHHPRQRVQWLHQTWLSNRVLTLKSLWIKFFSLW